MIRVDLVEGPIWLVIAVEKPAIAPNLKLRQVAGPKKLQTPEKF